MLQNTSKDPPKASLKFVASLVRPDFGPRRALAMLTVAGVAAWGRDPDFTFHHEWRGLRAVRRGSNVLVRGTVRRAVPRALGDRCSRIPPRCDLAAAYTNDVVGDGVHASFICHGRTLDARVGCLMAFHLPRTHVHPSECGMSSGHVQPESLSPIPSWFNRAPSAKRMRAAS